MKPADLEQFDSTAAWLEFCDGMSRFQAETEAARRQGLTRWEMMEVSRNAERGGNSERGGDNGSSLAGQQRQNDMPGVQPHKAQEGRSVPERDAQGGRAGLELLALRQ